MKKLIIRWLKSLFNGNPLVEQPKEYLQQVGGAYRTWLLVLAGIIGGTILFYIIFIICVLQGWI